MSKSSDSSNVRCRSRNRVNMQNQTVKEGLKVNMKLRQGVSETVRQKAGVRVRQTVRVKQTVEAVQMTAAAKVMGSTEKGDRIEAEGEVEAED